MFIRSHRGNRHPIVAPAPVQVEAPTEEKVSESVEISENTVAEEAKESELEENNSKTVERRTRRKREGK